MPIFTSGGTPSLSKESRAARAELAQASSLLLPFAIRGLATLGVADALAGGPAPVEVIAEAVGANTDALYRTLRFTAIRGIFTEISPRVFGLNAAAEFLRNDAAGSMRQQLMISDGTPAQLQVFTEVVHTLRTGESGYVKVNGMNPFEAMAANKEVASRISKQMREASRRLSQGVVDTADFSQDRVVADIGGGTGTMIGTILARHPQLSGILFDLPPVIADAPPVLDELGAGSRCQLVGGDMFAEVPAGADTYILSCVLHDWPDGKAAAVLGKVRAAMPGSSRLLVVEAAIGAGGTPVAMAIQVDFSMLINGGGRERTVSEHTALLEQAGFSKPEITTMPSGFSIIETRPEPGSGRPAAVAASGQAR